MAMRSVVSRGGLGRLMEINWRTSASGLRYLSDSGRVLSEEERAKETVYIQVSPTFHSAIILINSTLVVSYSALFD